MGILLPTGGMESEFDHQRVHTSSSIALRWPFKDDISPIRSATLEEWKASKGTLCWLRHGGTEEQESKIFGKYVGEYVWERLEC